MSADVLYTKAHRMHLSGLACDCGWAHRPIAQDIYVDHGLTALLPAILRRREIGGKALLVADGNTYRALGQEVERVLTGARMQVNTVVLSRAGGLALDEAALGQLLMGMSLDTEWFVGVGGGTVTGLARLAAALTERPYVCVPTAPTTDSYPMGFGRAWRSGELISLRANAPEIVACDLDALAPQLAPAGVGRMMTAFLSRIDWMAGSEPVCPLCAAMPADAAQRLMRAQAGPPFVRALMEALLVAGLAQHIWGGAQPMASCAQVAARHWCEARQGGGAGISDGMAQGVAALMLLPMYRALGARLGARRAGLGEAIGQLPGSGQMRAFMEKAGCPTRPDQLGLTDAQARAGLDAAVAACPAALAV